MARQTNGVDQYLVSASPLTLSGSSLLTISVWLWWDAYDTNYDAVLVSGNQATDDGTLYISPDYPQSKFTVNPYDASTSANFAVQCTRPTAGAWHHYVVSLDRSGTNENQLIGLWIDGSSAPGLTVPSAQDVASSWGDFLLYLMSDHNTGYYGAGRIAELALYSDVTFTQTDVDALYNEGTGAYATSVHRGNLAYYWPLLGENNPEPNYIGGIDMTVGGATPAAHPIILGKSSSRSGITGNSRFVTRIRYPRTDVPDTAWLGATLAPFDPSIVSAAAFGLQELHSTRTKKHKLLDSRVHNTEHDGWMGFYSETSKFTQPSILQLNLGDIQPKGKKLRLSEHVLWTDDTGWLQPNLDLTGGYGAQLYPAIDQQTNSFRTKPRQYRKPSTPGGAPRSQAGLAGLVRPALDQLLNSFRVRDYKKLQQPFHSMDGYLPSFTGDIVDAFTVEEWAAMGYDNYLMPKRIAKGHSLFWNAWDKSAFGIYNPYGPEWMNAIQQLLESFWLRARDKFPYLRLNTWEQDAWFGARATEPEVALVGSYQLLEGFLLGKARGRLWNTLRTDWNDSLGWINDIPGFNPVFFPALISSFESFRQGAKRKTDVRRLDTLMDAWMSRYVGAVIPVWSPAFQASRDSFRMRNRKITLDQLRTEDFHDMAWLKGVLDLTETPVVINIRAHWRQIAGAVMNRRRRRKRR